MLYMLSAYQIYFYMRNYFYFNVPCDSSDLLYILHYIMIFFITFLSLTLMFLPDYYVIAFYPAIIYMSMYTLLKPNTTIKCTSHLDQAQLLYRLTDSLIYARAKRLMRVPFLITMLLTINCIAMAHFSFCREFTLNDYTFSARIPSVILGIFT